MSEREDFIARICAEPDEDSHRLVFADWLDEHGEPERAEFIRLQCDLAKRGLTRQMVAGLATHKCTVCGALWRALGEHEGSGWSLSSSRCDPCCDNAPMGDQIQPVSADEISLLTREIELLGKHSREWFKDAIPGGKVSHWSANNAIPYFVLPGGAGRNFANIEITRGFVSGVSLPHEAFVGDGIACLDCEEGSPDWETGVVECRRCDSTGIIFGAITEELFAMHPITHVEFDDRTPGRYENAPYQWYWSPMPDRPGVIPVRYTIPTEVFYLMRDIIKDPHGNLNDSVAFDTSHEAVSELSRAAVSLGRNQAGLPAWASATQEVA